MNFDILIKSAIKLQQRGIDVADVICRIANFPKVKWIHPNYKDEHEEVTFQLETDKKEPFLPSWVKKRYNELKDFDEWEKALDKGKTMTFTRAEIEKIGNSGDTWKDLGEYTSKRKMKRTPRLYKETHSLQKPIYLENPKTEKFWCIAGNHRTTYVSDVLKQHVSALVIQ
jgi:hypothetical protein